MAGQKKHGKHDDWLEPEGLILIEGWARDGLMDEQIAKNIGIARSTLNLWKKKHPDISDALKRGKAVIDREVENALTKSATGYWIEELDTKVLEFPDGESRTETTTKRRWVPPNPTSNIFYLKNRKPETWRDRRETNIVSEVDNETRTIDIEKYLLASPAADAAPIDSTTKTTEYSDKEGE